MEGITLESIGALINSVGFPIVVSLLLIWFIYRAIEKVLDILDEMKELLIVIKEKVELILRLIERDG